MVSRKKALQKLWNDTCSVYTQEKVKNPITKRTEFVETALFENQPCKLSLDTLTATSQTDNAPSIAQGAKLFLSDELYVPSGSKIVVNRKDKKFTYKRSGEPGIFTYHQEIPLELFDKWA